MRRREFLGVIAGAAAVACPLAAAANWQSISHRILIFLFGGERESAACLFSGWIAAAGLDRRNEPSFRLQMVWRFRNTIA
jgi:hypothetical protein